jgi:hypothetical protein
MMISRWARFIGVAVGAMAVGLVLRAEAASSEDQRLHVAAMPADYAALGISQEIAIWEDGRRTPKSADTFEHWLAAANLQSLDSRRGSLPHTFQSGYARPDGRADPARSSSGPGGGNIHAH